MGALGRLLATLFGSLFTFLTRFFVVEKAFKVASIAVLLGVIGTLYGALKSCSLGVCSTAINSVIVDFPSFGMGLGIVFNTVTYSAAALYITVWTACQLYVLKKKMMGMITQGL